jgi:hypothetical protein
MELELELANKSGIGIGSLKWWNGQTDCYLKLFIGHNKTHVVFWSPAGFLDSI